MALKIYFCDGCNESIPLKDINENRITIDAGKIFCAKCAPKKPVREPARASPGFVAILIALVGIGFGLIAFITSQQIRDVGTALGEARKEIAALQTEVGALRRDAMPRDEAEKSRAKVIDAIGAVQKELAGQNDRLKIYEGLVRTEVDGVEKKLGDAFRAELTALAKQFNQLGEEWRGHAAASELLKTSIGAIESNVTQLRADLDAVRSMRVGGGGGGTESGPVEDGLPDDSSKDLLAGLKDADPGRRFAAVMELSRFRTPAVVTALEAMLQDPESYVRDGSIRTLKKINAPSSIPAIIKALRDDDFFVRSSARDALKTMTTMDIAFDPGADAADRESKVREWEGWWALNKERLLRPR
jgi:hypothetical protein